MAGIQVALNDEANRQEDYALTEKDLFGQQAQVNAKLSDEASAVAEASRISTTEQGQLALNNTIAARAAADVLGGNIQNHAAEQISGLATEQEENRGQLKVALGEYRKNVDASFFDNPVRWIHANVFGGTEAAAQSYNAVATQYNESKARMSTVLDQTRQEVANVRAMEFTTTDKIISAEARVKAFQYLEAAARADYNVLGSDIGGIRALATGGATALNMRVKAFDEQRADEEFKLRKAEFAQRIASEEFSQTMRTKDEARLDEEQAMRKGQYAEHKREVEDKEAGVKLQDNIIRAGFASLKLAVPDDVHIANIRRLLPTKEGQEKFGRLTSIGMDKLFQQDPENAPISLGSNPYDAIKAVNDFNPRLETDPTVAEYKPRIQYLNTVIAALEKNSGLSEKKDPIAFKAALLAKVKSDMDIAGQNSPSSKLTASPGFEVILKGNSALATSEFAKEVILPMQASGQVNSDEEQIMRVTAQAMKAKKLTVGEAMAGATEYFSTAMALNNRANFAFSIPLQTEYKAHIGTGKSVVLSRSANVTAALLQLQANDANFEVMRDFSNPTARIKPKD